MHIRIISPLVKVKKLNKTKNQENQYQDYSAFDDANFVLVLTENCEFYV